MYKANPQVNVELRLRLPSPVKQQHSNATEQRSNTDRGSELGTSPTNQTSLTNQTTPTSQTNQTSLTNPTSLLLDAADLPQAPQHLQAFQEPSTSRSSSPPSSRPQGAPGGMEVDLACSRGPSPQVESSSEGAGGGASPGSPVYRRYRVNTDSTHKDSMCGSNRQAGRVMALDRDKNISFLLKELDSLRDLNKKLQAQLVHKEKELERKEVEEELKEVQQEARNWERPAAVLEEVYAAQKDRDQALMSRLLLANEERDEAVLRVRRLQQAATELENINLEESDMDVEDLLQCVCAAESGQEVERFGSVLVQRLWSARQRRHDITAQEMKAVMEERDGSVARCQRLEQDLIQEREQTADKELLTLQRERDKALEDKLQLEEELQTLRAYHSLHHSQSGSSLSSQDLQTSQASQPSLPRDGASPVDMAVQQVPLVLQLQQLTREKQKIQTELHHCQEAEKEARERVHRLERLVEVLRKKVGTGSVRAVI